MSDIKLNDILCLSDEEIKKSKMELNMQAGPEGESYIYIWLNSSDENKKEGTCPKCGYWGWYGNQRNFRPEQWVFNFIRLRGNEWLFISAAEIKEVPKNSHAKIEIIDKYKPYFGRLVIELTKGNTHGRYTFNLSKYIEDSKVKKILPSLYDGDDFPGYDNVNLSYRQLETIIKNNKRDWIAALENQKAVYLLTDRKNGKMYVGSATSEHGMLLKRWTEYIEKGDGGNIKLKKLVEEKGFGYIKSNFNYAILENYNSKVGDQFVLKRESWWKETLQTKIHGYNKN